MSTSETVITITIAALATMLTRFLPFLIFKSGKPTPKFLVYLGEALPPAVFGMLVVYCLRGISFAESPNAIPEIIGVCAVVLLHLAFRKMILSIVGGTALYLILVNFVFI